MFITCTTLIVTCPLHVHCTLVTSHPSPSPPSVLVSGIYTVLRSKAGATTAELGDLYCMLGPYNEDCVKLEVEVMEPEFSVLKETVEAMRKEGVKVRAWG